MKQKAWKTGKEQYGNKSRKTTILKAGLKYTWSQEGGMKPQKKNGKLIRVTLGGTRTDQFAKPIVF